MIQISDWASPGASAAFQCHCSQRAELTSEPFSSAKQVVGSWKTSVWMLAGSDGFCGPKSSQNREVSVSSGSIVTRNFSLLRPSDLAPVRESLQRIEALADVAVHLAVRHHLEGSDDVVSGISSFGSQS